MLVDVAIGDPARVGRANALHPRRVCSIATLALARVITPAEMIDTSGTRLTSRWSE